MNERTKAPQLEAEIYRLMNDLASACAIPADRSVGAHLEKTGSVSYTVSGWVDGSWEGRTGLNLTAALDRFNRDYPTGAELAERKRAEAAALLAEADKIESQS